MKAITYQIRLLEPALVTALEGDPNSAVAFDFLPGSVLRGLLVGRYLRSRRVSTGGLDAADPLARRLFFGGTTRYLNGYPLDALAERTLPVPHSFYCLKGQDTPVYDFAAEEPEDVDGDQQWVVARGPFCALDDDELRPVRPERHIAVHTARDRRLGRAAEGSGALYRYDALAPGQAFAAAIVCDREQDAAELLPLLDGEATLGGSRSGGYGRVQLEHATEVPGAWSEAGSTSAGLAGRLVVTLLSDALLRDPGTGQFVVDAAVVAGELGRLLQASVTLHQSFFGGRAVGGFNRKWGLPLPQALAIRMGGVFVLNAAERDADRLRRLEASGIGERRAEGFGRLAINWHGSRSEYAVQQEGETPAPAPVALAPGSGAERLAAQMGDRMLRQRLDRAIGERANVLGEQVRGPSASQLSRARAIIRDALSQEPAEGRERLRHYLDRIDQRPKARAQFLTDRVGGKPLMDWLRERLREGDEIWRDLYMQSGTLPSVGSVTAALPDHLAYECNLRLAHDVLARAAKSKRKEEG